MPSTILDAWGKPAIRFGPGPLYERSAADTRLRPRPANHFDDYISLLSSSQWERLISESRAVGAQGIVAAAIQQRADYLSASHWRPYFSGQDADWGDAAEELLEDTTSFICTRGNRFDWRTFWHLGCTTVLPDGGFFVLLTENENGWPLLQPIEAHRIGQREHGSAIVTPNSAFSTVKNEDGEISFPPTKYFGLKIVNGIIYNKAGAEVAFRVLGPTPEEDEDISAQDMIHIARPQWFSEGRPVPQLAPGLMDLLGVTAARTAQLDAQINHSKLVLIESNDTGKQEQMRKLLNPSMTPTTESGNEPEVLERGTVRYVKSNGAKIEAHEAKVPTDQWMNFDTRSLSSSIAAIGWRLEMLFAEKMGGNFSRALMDQINTLISSGFEDFRPAAVRCTRYRISKFIKLGLLKPNAEFLRWNITPPPDFKVDRNGDKTDVDMVRAGADNMPNVMRRNGIRARQSLVAQAKFVQDQQNIAAKYGVPFELLGNLTIPGTLPPTAEDNNPQPDPNEPSPADEKKDASE
jgi:hypothetical protein